MTSEHQQPTEKAVASVQTLIEYALFQLNKSPTKSAHPRALESSLQSALDSLPDPGSRDALSARATRAMNELKTSLQALQDLARDDGAVAEATKAVAKALAVLYPLARAEENPSRLPASPLEPNPPQGSERRTAPRVAIEADIGFQSETNFFVGFTEDISEGGIFVSTYDTRSIGTRLSINFALPDGHIIAAEGEVRWLREYNETNPDTTPGMGIQFLDLSPEDRDAIQTFIQLRQPMFYDE